MKDYMKELTKNGGRYALALVIPGYAYYINEKEDHDNGVIILDQNKKVVAESSFAFSDLLEELKKYKNGGSVLYISEQTKKIVESLYFDE